MVSTWQLRGRSQRQNLCVRHTLSSHPLPGSAAATLHCPPIPRRAQTDPVTTPCVATKVTMLCISNRLKTEYNGPPHPPPSSSPQGCPRAHQLKFQVFDTMRRTILPYKCKTRFLNPSGRRKASFFLAPTSSVYKTNFTFRMKTPLPNYNDRKPNLLVTIISFTVKYAERGPS